MFVAFSQTLCFNDIWTNHIKDVYGAFGEVICK